MTSWDGREGARKLLESAARAALCHCGRLLELIASSVLRGTGAYAQVRTVCWLRRGTQGRGIVATSDSFPRRGALGGNYLYFLVRL